jgi:hypothetical protein
VARWYNQSLGVFGFYKPDIYDDNLRTDPAFVINTFNGGVGASPCDAVPPGNTGTQCANTGIFNPGNSHIANAASVIGVDGTLSLAPWSIPLSLDNQIMWRRESSPTGFGVSFSWRGGFEQLNWFIRPDLVTYARYDWIRGSTFNDTNVGGITFSNPNEWDIVAGIQWAPWQNVKLIGEYRYHQFKDNATGTPGTDICAQLGNPTCQPYTNRVTPASITDNGFTVRLMMGL